MADAVLLERSGPVASPALNRPDKHNALRFADLDRLVALLHEAEDDDEVKAIVLRGARPDCCLGTTTTTRPGPTGWNPARPARNPAVPVSARGWLRTAGSG